MTAGSIGGGAVGEAVSIRSALLIGAADLPTVAIVMHSAKLAADDAELVPSNHGPGTISRPGARSYDTT